MGWLRQTMCAVDAPDVLCSLCLAFAGAPMHHLVPVRCADVRFGDMRFADVCRKLRDMFGIDAGDYMLSLCSDAALRLLNTPGKSGAFFFLSCDDKVRLM